MTTKMYEVQKMTFDAARPYAVVATFRSFNRVVAKYEDEAAAKRHARSMNRYHKRQGLPVGNTAPCGALADFINGEC
jgi:hypothetical protein